MKKLPIFVSNFEEMITGNYLYIDKTQFIYPLVKEKGYYFLSRPRRFGKSLFISTLKELFLGNKKLFENLLIASSSYEWVKYPIIYLDFGTIDHGTAEELKIALSWKLKTIAQGYNINIDNAPTLGSMLDLLVVELSKKNKVVILIDEYDKPMLDHLHNIKEAQKQQAVLHSFYATIKGLDAYIRAIFITGVTKFAKTSVFSGMNNLNDISLKPEACQLLGYTEHEILEYFHDYLIAFAQKTNTTTSETLIKLQQWYNGYRFCEADIKVYNPFSVLYCLNDFNFNNYWFKSGTPSFLIHVMRKKIVEASEIEKNSIISKQALDRTFEITDIPLLPLLYETGYLTVKSFNETLQQFTLGYPNAEVRESFRSYLLAAFTSHEVSTIETITTRLITALNKDDMEQFCILLQTLFANVPHQLYSKKKEVDYHTIFQIVFSMLGTNVQSEVSTNKGRIDVVILTQSNIYIFEIKADDTAEHALQQIEENTYHQKYLFQNKKITLIGLAFNRDNHVLDLDFAIKKLNNHTYA